VVIIPLVKIRDNKKFNSLEELKKQIQRDLAWAENHPQVVITF
jgi:FAD synthase